MSRIGKLPIEIPANVKVTVGGGVISVEGPKGKLKETLQPGNEAITFENKDNLLILKRSSDERSVFDQQFVELHKHH